MPDIAGPYSASVAETLVFDDWWLECPENPIYNMTLSVIHFYRHNKEEQTVYKPLSRPKPVVVRGVIRSEEFNLKIEFLTEADFTKFEQIRGLQLTLLLKRGYTGEQWYIVLGANRGVEEAPADHTYKVIEIGATEVDAP